MTPRSSEGAPAPGRAEPDSSGHSRRRWRPGVLPVVVALVSFVGMCVLLYPMTASWVAQVNQSRVVAHYDDRASSPDLVPSAAQQLAMAHRYNDLLSSGAAVEKGKRLPTGQGTENSAMSYEDLLHTDDTGVMGRIRIPAIQVDLPIYHGTDDATLLKGIGHLEGTSLPVGGPGTHAVLTGHRGLASATLFTNLDKVKVGDTFSITVLTQTLSYVVTSTTVVDPDQTQLLRPVAGKDLVTLVTCTPLGINTQRILVTGERILPTPAADVTAAHARPDIPGFPWWAVILAAGSALIGLYLWRIGYPAAPTKNSPASAQGARRGRSTPDDPPAGRDRSPRRAS
ncbi:sortase A [Propionibacterium cyclohexanicum]|uniref:Sortase A n=1 Tax=Propionibacterium cyclohexanicum TaxID=64702 RepID=A0A1H9RQM2_9ACTN|nr:class C sortase [Propionibacterium cyclohexanicum]SER74894.1 sortase A [Propionibacterium cyclohexanicum]